VVFHRSQPQKGVREEGKNVFVRSVILETGPPYWTGGGGGKSLSWC